MASSEESSWEQSSSPSLRSEEDSASASASASGAARSSKATRAPRDTHTERDGVESHRGRADTRRAEEQEAGSERSEHIGQDDAEDGEAAEQPRASAGAKRRRSEDTDLKVLSYLHQIQNYRKDKRGRRGAIAVTQAEYVDALADAFAVTSSLLPPAAAAEVEPTSDEEVITASDLDDPALCMKLIQELTTVHPPISASKAAAASKKRSIVRARRKADEPAASGIAAAADTLDHATAAAPDDTQAHAELDTASLS